MFIGVSKKENLFYDKFIYQELSFSDVKTYLFSVIFVAGNVILPYILHYFYFGAYPLAKIFLPIYFFVLIGAYKFGWKVGILTALFSPIVSFGLTQMPPSPILFFVIIKGLILASIAGFLAKKYKVLSFFYLLFVIVLYQGLGSLIIYFLTQNTNLAFFDWRIGYPGLLVQLFLGYFVLKLLQGYEFKIFRRNKEKN